MTIDTVIFKFDLSAGARETDWSDLAPTVDRLGLTDSELRYLFTHGSGEASKANLLWHSRFQVSASSTKTFDLLAGVEDGLFGTNATFTTVRGLYFRNTEVGQGDQKVLIGRPSVGGWNEIWEGSQAATAGEHVYAGGSVMKVNPTATGWVVESANKDLIVVNDNAFIVTCDLLLLGDD